MKFEDVENYMVEKAKKESLELAQDLESKQMKALTQKMSKMEELMREILMKISCLISSRCLNFRILMELEIQGSTLVNIQPQ